MVNRLNVADISVLKEFKNEGVRFLDEDVMLIDKFTSLPSDLQSFKLDMVVVVLCYSGRLQVNINGNNVLVEKDSLLLCTNLHMLANAMFSSDFRSSIFAVSLKRLELLLSVYKQSIKTLFMVNDDPVLPLLPEELHIFKHYKELFDAKYNTPRHELFSKSLDSLIQGALYDVIGVCNRVLRHRQLSNSSSVKRTTNALVQRFLMLLADDTTHHRTVDYFADKLCISPKYLSTLCKKETGKGPSIWIREMLVEHIRYLLTNSSLSCKEISSQLEFPNSSFFGKFVKQHLGTSPQEYRKKHQ